MEFNYKYSGQSRVKNNAGTTSMKFAPDTFREPTFFSGLLNKKIPFREAISALHHIVVSDFRYQPKDRTAYLEWAKQQEGIWLAEAMAGAADVKAELESKKRELTEINKHTNEILAPYYKARSDYWKHLYVRDRDAWIVLDPVISVHPDELFFECFSKDESSYGKLSCNYNVFKELGEFACGTTNIDYTQPLYYEFQKIRNYKDTEFIIDPSGFEVTTTNEASYKEVKIDLPESWVRGFLQVSSAMTLPAYQFEIHPMDLSNILFYLKRNREKKGPRSIRWILKSGEPVKARIDPWGDVIDCRRSIYVGKQEGEVRMWGRRRLALMERLIPIVKKINVTLLGTGLPSFFEADLYDMTFTLGLSGWTSNDWSRSSNFDLMTPRFVTDGADQQKIYLALKAEWYASAAVIAQKLSIDEQVVESALTNFIQEGKVVYDLHKKVYRIRELTKDALPVDQLRYKNPREQKAALINVGNRLKYEKFDLKEHSIVHHGSIEERKTLNISIEINDDERLVAGSCGCEFYKNNKLYQGPCEHMMALRKLATNRVDALMKNN